MAHTELNLRERRTIEDLLNAKMPVSKIASEIGRHRSTIHRELKRNFHRDGELPQLNGYHAVAAQNRYEERRAIHRKLIVHPNLKSAVTDSLKAGWSPEQIAGRMKLEEHPIRVSHETIYRFAYSKTGQSEELYRHLPEHRRRRRARNARRQHGARFSEEVAICHRPAKVAKRVEFGHWECDLMMFRKEHGRANVTSLVERVSRFAVVLKNPDRQSKPVMESLIEGLAPLPKNARRSITFDRGTELSAWPHLKAGLAVDPWFCDPQAPWQKGTVENTNRRLRRYLPRQADPSAFTNRYLRSICDRLNAQPRKCLGFRTPTEVFRDKLMEIMRKEP